MNIRLCSTRSNPLRLGRGVCGIEPAALLALLVIILALPGCGSGPSEAAPFDLVLKGGRVMDPESGLDAVRNVAISEGRIQRISETDLDGREVLDVSGLVVSAGFIDLHAHGQDPVSNRLQAADGVTTALEMEVGVYPVGSWIASREGKALINFGATAGHWPARMKLVQGVEVGHFPTLPSEKEDVLTKDKRYAYAELSDEQIDQLGSLLDQGLKEGGLGFGFGITYTPGASRREIFRLFQLAAQRQVPGFVHVRGENSGGTLGAFQEMIAIAGSTGASVQIVHLNSSADEEARVALEMIRGARARGLDVTTESYPYTAGSTKIETALFDSWEGLTDEEYGRLQWPANGERLNRETFAKYRKQGGWVIIHGRQESTNEWIVAQPDVMVASDGIPYLNGPAHPRGAGTFSRVLGVYVRQRQALSLMEALAKMTLLPAQRLERVCRGFKDKGRIREGADADLTVFDPNTVLDRATYEQGDLPSEGIQHVLVGGTFVVRDGAALDGVFPGRAMRGVYATGAR